MVNRDFECLRCGRLEEHRAGPTQAFQCICRGVMVAIISLGTVQAATDSLWPMVHPNLGHHPVEVKGWGHFNRLLKARGVTNPLMD